MTAFYTLTLKPVYNNIIHTVSQQNHCYITPPCDRCVYPDSEAEQTSAAAGRRKQRTYKARGDPLLSHCGFLAPEHMDVVPSLR